MVASRLSSCRTENYSDTFHDNINSTVVFHVSIYFQSSVSHDLIHQENICLYQGEKISKPADCFCMCSCFWWGVWEGGLWAPCSLLRGLGRADSGWTCPVRPVGWWQLAHPRLARPWPSSAPFTGHEPWANGLSSAKLRQHALIQKTNRRVATAALKPGNPLPRTDARGHTPSNIIHNTKHGCEDLDFYQQ